MSLFLWTIMCNFWLCVYGQQNNTISAGFVFVFCCFLGVWGGVVSLRSSCQAELEPYDNTPTKCSDEKRFWLPYLIQYFRMTFPLVILPQECNMAEQSACIPSLLCGSALHLTLYWYQFCGPRQPLSQKYLGVLSRRRDQTIQKTYLRRTYGVCTETRCTSSLCR